MKLKHIGNGTEDDTLGVPEMARVQWLGLQGRLEEFWRERDAPSPKTSWSKGIDSALWGGWNWWKFFKEPVTTKHLFFTLLIMHVPSWLWQLQLTASSQADMQGSSQLSSHEPWASCPKSWFRMCSPVARSCWAPPALHAKSRPWSQACPLRQRQLLYAFPPNPWASLCSQETCWVPQMWSCLLFQPQQKSSMTIFIAVAILGAGWRFSPLVAEHCPFIFHHPLQVCTAKTRDTNRFY